MRKASPSSRSRSTSYRCPTGSRRSAPPVGFRSCATPASARKGAPGRSQTRRRSAPSSSARIRHRRSTRATPSIMAGRSGSRNGPTASSPARSASASFGPSCSRASRASRPTSRPRRPAGTTNCLASSTISNQSSKSPAPRSPRTRAIYSGAHSRSPTSPSPSSSRSSRWWPASPTSAAGPAP